MKPNKAGETPQGVRLQSEYPHPPERVWRALTDPNALARWLLPSSFSPQVGRRFAFIDKSNTGRRRKVQCQVVELDAPHRLAYTWQAEDENLPTLVAWTLEPTEAGTRVTLEHVGPAAPFAAEPNGLTMLANALQSRAFVRDTAPVVASFTPRRQQGRIVFAANGEGRVGGMHRLPASSAVAGKTPCGLSSCRAVRRAPDKEVSSCIR